MPNLRSAAGIRRQMCLRLGEGASMNDEELKLILWAELEKIAPRGDDHEQEYRRGYCDGWIAATNALFDLWFLRGKRCVYDELYDHWQYSLIPWRSQDIENHFHFPPHCFVPCTYCGKPSEHMDHFVPKSKGGRSTSENLVPACAKCNIEKSDMNPVDWERRLALRG